VVATPLQFCTFDFTLVTYVVTVVVTYVTFLVTFYTFVGSTFTFVTFTFWLPLRVALLVYVCTFCCTHTHTRCYVVAFWLFTFGFGCLRLRFFVWLRLPFLYVYVTLGCYVYVYVVSLRWLLHGLRLRAHVYVAFVTLLFTLVTRFVVVTFYVYVTLPHLRLRLRAFTFVGCYVCCLPLRLLPFGYRLCYVVLRCTLRCCCYVAFAFTLLRCCCCCCGYARTVVGWLLRFVIHGYVTFTLAVYMPVHVIYVILRLRCSTHVGYVCLRLLRLVVVTLLRYGYVLVDFTLRCCCCLFVVVTVVGYVTLYVCLVGCVLRYVTRLPVTYVAFVYTLRLLRTRCTCTLVGFVYTLFCFVVTVVRCRLRWFVLLHFTHVAVTLYTHVCYTYGCCYDTLLRYVTRCFTVTFTLLLRSLRYIPVALRWLRLHVRCLLPFVTVYPIYRCCPLFICFVVGLRSVRYTFVVFICCYVCYVVVGYVYLRCPFVRSICLLVTTLVTLC